MWISYGRSVTARLNMKLPKFNLFNVNNVKFISDTTEISSYNDHPIMDESWNATSVRSDDIKSLRIAILGLPNVGKSTLINSLVGRPVCAASSKSQTTRVKSNAIYVEDNTQLVFVDTPGLVTNQEVKKFKLENSFRTDVDRAVAKADVVGVIQDASNPFTNILIDDRILMILKNLKSRISTILILNKIDRVKKKKSLLGMVDILTSKKGWTGFSDIFMVSALESDGVDDLRKYLIESAKPRDWDYKSGILTDEAPENIVERIVRAKFLDNLPQELPYVLNIMIEHMSTLSDGSINVVVVVSPPNCRISKIVLGKGGARLKGVAIMSEQELCKIFRTTVRLKIAVKFAEQKEELTKCKKRNV